MDDQLVKGMVASVNCGSCGRRYPPENVEIIDRKGDLWFLSALCGSCHVRILAAAVIRDVRPEILMDLSPAELDKFRQTGRITEDDLLAVHAFLKGYRGDVSGLFQPED